MTSIKKLEQFLERDPTNELFSGLTLELLYKWVSQHCSLHDGVPEEVRDYFHVIVTLFLYGWNYYPFYTLASERSLFAVEMALRKRFPPPILDKKGRDPRNLVDVFTEARDSGFLRDEGFPSLDIRRANAEEMNQHIAEILGREPKQASEVPFVDGLISTWLRIRNSFAHPHIQNIMPPGMAFDGLNLAAEIINQLWPIPSVS